MNPEHVQLEWAARLASTLTARDARYHTELRPVGRGRSVRVYFADYVLIRKVTTPVRRALEQDPCRRAELRAPLNEVIGDVIREAEAFWENSKDLLQQLNPPDENLVLLVPRFLALRPGPPYPNLQVPPSLLVCGANWSGCSDVSASLAWSLGWAHIEVGKLADRTYGDTKDSAARREQRAMHGAELAARLLEDPEGAARWTSWSIEGLDVATGLLESLRSSGTCVDDSHRPALPLVIFLRCTDNLLRYSAWRSQGRHAGEDEIFAAYRALLMQQQGVETAIRARASGSWVVIEVGDFPEADDVGTDKVDVFFDEYVKTALLAAWWLHRCHNGPPLTDLEPAPDRRFDCQISSSSSPLARLVESVEVEQGLERWISSNQHRLT